MKLHKKEIARRQIETALDLFFSQGDAIAVITLAGASEEILGNLIRRNGTLCMMDHLIELDRDITEGGRSIETVNSEVNGVRNSLKHANDPHEDEVDVDDQHGEAMLARAIANYIALEGKEKATPTMLRFYEYIKLLHPDVCS